MSKTTTSLHQSHPYSEQENLQSISFQAIIHQLQVIIGESIQHDLSNFREDDSLLQLNMSSVQVVECTLNLQDAFNYQFSTHFVYTYPTLKKMALFIQEALAPV